LELNRTHQIPIYAYDVNLRGENISNISKGVEGPIEVSKVRFV